MHAWHTMLHTAWDGNGGGGAGIGGSGVSSNGFAPGGYGPGGSAIDTRRPFRVHASFMAADDGTGAFRGLWLQLAQDGRVQIQFGSWPPGYLAPLGSALQAGMTLVMSYWSSSNMDWLSGGLCANDHMSCGDHVTFSELAICDGVTLCAFSGVEKE